MTEGSSYFPKACELSENLSYTNVVELMLENAISRINNNNTLSRNIIDIPHVPLEKIFLDRVPTNNRYLNKSLQNI